MAIMVLSSVLSAATRADAVVLVIGGASPGFNGKPGWARLTSWIWLISSQLETMAVSGGLKYSRTTLNAHESQHAFAWTGCPNLLVGTLSRILLEICSASTSLNILGP